jgi:hypothetical protein
VRAHSCVQFSNFAASPRCVIFETAPSARLISRKAAIFHQCSISFEQNYTSDNIGICIPVIDKLKACLDVHVKEPEF